jgi:hypothetical protein
MKYHSSLNTKFLFLNTLTSIEVQKIIVADMIRNSAHHDYRLVYLNFFLPSKISKFLPKFKSHNRFSHEKIKCTNFLPHEKNIGTMIVAHISFHSFIGVSSLI